MYHISFYHFHCINPILFYSPPILPMSSKHIPQCSNCHQWPPTIRGACMKHIQHCQPKLTGSTLLDQDRIRSLNPLLSLTTNGHSPNIDYNCNLYVDQYHDDDYGEGKTSVNNNSNISGSKDILDNDNINENNLQEAFMSFNKTSSQQTNATN